MLHRSTSSRRRRASRSVTNPSQPSAGQQGQPAPRSRRASVASTEPASEALLGIQGAGGLLAGMQGMDRQRSPRGSCVPNIALDTEDETQEEVSFLLLILFLYYISRTFFFLYREVYTNTLQLRGKYIIWRLVILECSGDLLVYYSTVIQFYLYYWFLR